MKKNALVFGVFSFPVVMTVSFLVGPSYRRELKAKYAVEAAEAERKKNEAKLAEQAKIATLEAEFLHAGRSRVFSQ